MNGELIELEKAASSELNMRPYELYDYLEALNKQGLDLESINSFSFNAWGFLKEFMKKGSKKPFDTSFFSSLQHGAIGGTNEWGSFGKEWGKIDKQDISGFVNSLRGLLAEIKVRKPILDTYSEILEEDYPGFYGNMVPDPDYIINAVREKYGKEAEEAGFKAVIPEKEKHQWEAEVKEIIRKWMRDMRQT